ncbi:uncharacterized protein HKW66_Vig0189030 [Vigna angularis]|uniref:DUF3700 domain-containing protein n=1 Tax=Phaseolus angularis TaxID=3914 RepID=A0A8T0KV78_PHAAN|nr:uncharacterized protein HKW66_Vig0189030 [Vigna angularis]
MVVQGGGASFVGCFYSTAVGGLRCYENPKNKITAVPAEEEEIWGATFKVWFRWRDQQFLQPQSTRFILEYSMV